MADEKELTLVLKARNLASREVDRLHRSLGGVGTGARKAGAGLLRFAKIVTGVAAIAVTAFAGGIFLATRAAADEQKSVAKLGAALKANAKHWSGSLAGIEKVIKQRERLAFSDDDLRESLARLVVANGSVNKSLKLQTVAMDVARLKGIDLTAASVLLIKAQGGNTRALKELGIQLPKTATATQILTAIQKKAAGQAEAYGKTSAGAQQAFQIALNDVVEDVGSFFLPIMTQLFRFLVDKGIPAIRGVISTVQKWFSENKVIIGQITNFVGSVLARLISVLGTVIGKIAEFIGAVSRNKPVMDALRKAVQFVADAFAFAEKAIGFVIDKIAALIGWVRDAIDWLAKMNKQLADFKPIGGGGPTGAQAVHPHAAGGWVGLHGPELGIVGEKGPEYIVPNNKLGSMGGSQTIVLNIDGKTVATAVVPAVSRQLFYELQRAAPTLSRT